MQWTKTCTIMPGLLSVLFVTSSLAQVRANNETDKANAPAEVAAIEAIIQNIDQSSRLLRFRTSNHEIIELQTPEGMLEPLHPGDRIEVVIRKYDQATPSSTEPPTR
jgi:hypothetical protein